jgi:hypothetical protein
MLDTLYSNITISERNRISHYTTYHTCPEATLVAMLQHLAVRIRNA